MTSTPSSPGQSRAIAMILGSCISLQFGAALATQLFADLGPVGVTTLRLGIAGMILLVLIRPAVHLWTTGQWRAVVLFGLTLGAMNGCFYLAIDRIPLGTAVAIEFLGPLVLAAILSRRGRDLLCVLLALLGMGLFGVDSMLGAESLDLVGVLFAAVAGVFWGCYVLTSARVGQLIPGQGGLAVAVTIGSLGLLPMGMGGVIEAVANPQLLLLAGGTALLATVIPYTLELSALRRLPRHVFGVLLSLEPVIALIAGLILLGQGVTPLTVGAVVLVVIASIGITLSARPPRAGTPDEVRGKPQNRQAASRSERFSAETTASMDARTIDPSMPTPQ
ncbi:MAG: DMT family transporter [Brachybacterium sp.]|nr:DMT family transporter [Brachybacterium sp.]